MSTATSTVNDFCAPGQLVPAEVNAALQREGDAFPREPRVSGFTVNEEGLTNNYAVAPKTSYAVETTDEEKFRLGVMFAIATWVPIAIAIAVS